MELSKPVKIAYDLNDECLNPQTIEKTMVSLAFGIFGYTVKFSGYTINEVSNIVEILSLKCCCPGLTMHT